MPETKVEQTIASDLTTAMTDFSVDTQETDGATGTETRWTNDKWAQYLGYYKEIPEINTVIDARATWTVGKGFKADEETTLLLDSIKGNGKDTFNTIVENAVRTYTTGGDAYIEIIRDEEENLINLKPLDPGTMVHINDAKGMFVRFEQTSKGKNKNKRFKPEDILYLPRNRIADEVHGISMVEKLAKIILMRNEAMNDWQRVMHRNIDPLWIFHMDTDDVTEIAAFKVKQDAARGKGENLYVPKGVIVPELVGVAPNATLNPLAWIERLTDYFYEAANCPKIIVGGTGGITEAAVKIAYLAWQQTIEEEQLFLEEQILAQLNLVVEFEFPVSLENELLSDKEKDGAENIDASETTAGQSK